MCWHNTSVLLVFSLSLSFSFSDANLSKNKRGKKVELWKKEPRICILLILIQVITYSNNGALERMLYSCLSTRSNLLNENFLLKK